MEITIKQFNGDNITLGLGSMPGRKRKALYRKHGFRIDPIAYFSSEQDAEWVEGFMRKLAELANGTITETRL